MLPLPPPTTIHSFSLLSLHHGYPTLALSHRYDWSEYPNQNVSGLMERAFDQEGYKNATITGVKAHTNDATGIPDIYLTVPR